MTPPDDILLEDERDALQLTADENADLCAGCTRCCETVSIEIDAPRSPWEYDQWIWVLHHRNLEIYLEKPEAWFLHIEARCEQLKPNGHCAVYTERPVLCREYDPRGCERRAPLSDITAWFKTAADLERWLQEKRPAHWKRLLAHREANVGATGAAGAAGAVKLAQALVQLGEPAAPRAHEPATKLPRKRPR